MQVQFSFKIFVFSLQTDRSGRPVLTKGKRPKCEVFLMKSSFHSYVK